MSETTSLTPTPEPTPAPVADPAAAVSSPAATPEAPAAAPPEAAPAAEVAAEPAVKLHTDTPTLLEGTSFEEPKAETPAPAPAETPKPAAETPPPAPTPDTPAPVTYDFKLPEGVEAEPAQIEAYTGVLREANIPPEIGQRLLDMHAAQVQRLAESTLANQHQVFADTRKQWADQIRSDPELGGSGHQTAAKAVARARDLFVPEADRKAFNEFLTVTGAGDHPAFWRMLYRASRFIDEPAPIANARPSPSANPQPRTGFRALMDHPSSRRVVG